MENKTNDGNVPARLERLNKLDKDRRYSKQVNDEFAQLLCLTEAQEKRLLKIISSNDGPLINAHLIDMFMKQIDWTKATCRTRRFKQPEI